MHKLTFEHGKRISRLEEQDVKHESHDVTVGIRQENALTTKM